MKITSDLTIDEQNISSFSKYDFGVGYPEFNLPKWLDDIWDKQSNFELIQTYLNKYHHISVPNNYHSPKSNILERELKLSVCKTLGISVEHIPNVFITYSGSHALERTISSLFSESDEIITTNPSIDIITAIVSELPLVKITYADNTANFEISTEKIVSKITSKTKALILCSPENPTGEIISENKLNDLIDICIEKDIILILDQCFYKVNPYNIAIPQITNLYKPQLKWVQIWDTGKTFDLDDEKLGFIITCSSLQPIIKLRVDILQCTLPKRWLMLFKIILDLSLENNYFEFLNQIIRNNIEYSIDKFKGTEIKVITPKAGGLLLLDVSKHKNFSSDIEFANQLLSEKNIGIVKANSFFYKIDNGKFPDNKNSFVRVALAREPAIFKTVIDLICEFAS